MASEGEESNSGSAMFKYLLPKVQECLSTETFVEQLDLLNGAESTTEVLIFDGLDSLTDETFLALNDKVKEWGEGSKLSQSVTSVSCVGCVELTDWGVFNLVSVLPKLQQVILDGCPKLTERSLSHIKEHCPDVKLISMIAASVSYQPQFPANVKLVLDGCPVVHQHQELTESAPKPAYKLVILSSRASHRVAEVLFEDLPKDAESKRTKLTEETGNTFKYHPSAKLVSAAAADATERDFVLNVMELHSRNVSLSGFLPAFLSEKAIYMMTFDIDEVQENQVDNPVLHIMMRLNSVRGQVRQSPIVVLALHKASSDVDEALTELSGQLEQAFQLQKEILNDHITVESYKSSRACTRDFQTQQKYARSRFVQHPSNANTYSLYSVNKDTLEMKKYLPHEDNSQKLEQDFTELKQTYEEQIERLTQTHLEPAFFALDSLNKNDISELKSFASPPSLAVKCLEGVCILLDIRLPTEREDNGTLRASWAIIKRHILSRPSFIYQLKEYDKDSLTQRQLTALQYYTDNPELTPERARPVSAKPAEKQTGQKGSSTLADVIIEARKNLEAMYPEEDARQLCMSPFLETVQKRCSELGPGIFPLSQVQAVVNSTKGVSSDIRKTGKALEKLHKMGKLFYYPDAPSQPVVPDVPWFMKLLLSLASADAEQDMLNRDRYKAVGPDIAMFKTDHFTKMWAGQADQQQAERAVELLKYFGLLLPAPRRTFKLETEVDEDETEVDSLPLMRYIQLPEKTFIRDNLGSGQCSSVPFKHDYWPDFRSDHYNEHDVQVEVGYRFTMGMPPGLFPAIMADFIKMGQVIFVSRWIVLAQMGAAEICLMHNVHGTMVSSHLDIQARVTNMDMEEEHAKLQQFLWSAISPYLLVIDYHISRYPHLHARVRVPCQGSCTKVGLAHTFSPVEFVPELNATLKCDRCGDQGMSAADVPYLTGRTWGPPFHDFREVESNRAETNLVAPFNCEYQTESLSWVCHHCGILKPASMKLWEMQSSLYPTFVRHSFRQSHVADKAQEHSQKCTSLVTGKPYEAGTDNRVVVQCRHPPFLNGLLAVHITVVAEGSVTLVLTDPDFFGSEVTETDLEKTWMRYNISTGEHLLQQLDAKSEDDAPISEVAQLEKLTVGDTLTVRVLGAITVDKGAQEYVMLKLSLEKNNQAFHTNLVPFRCFLGLVMESDPETCPKVVLEAPTSPVVHASHFPLGSALLYKSGHGNQYTLGRVLAIRGEQLLVGTPDDTSQQRQLGAHSEELYPVGIYSTNISILIGKEPMKSKDQIAQYLDDNQCWPAPFGLFCFKRTLQQGTVSSVKLRQPDAYYCTVNSNSPQALEQEFLYNAASSVHQRFKAKTAHVFLPRELTLSKLMNPTRQAAQDWPQQALHFICRGFENNRFESSCKDVHMMSLSPLDLPWERVSQIYQHFVEDELIAYHSMQNHQSILPDWELIFPQIPKDMPLNEVIEGIQGFMGVYRCTFILANRLQESLVTKYKPKKINYKSTQSYLNTLLDQHAAPLKENRARRCDTHDKLSKKAVTNYLKTEMPYSQCVAYLTISHVNLEKVFASIFGLLPNLQGVQFQSNHLVSLEGIGQAQHLQSLTVSNNEIPCLPPELENLKGTLSKLVFSNNPVEELPGFILDLKKLRHLDFSNTLISKVPEDIGELRNLKQLEMKSTTVHKLPDSLCKLKRLEILSLTGVPWLSNPDKDVDTLLTQTQWTKWCKSESRSVAALSKEEKASLFTECDVNKSGNLANEEIVALNNKLLKRFPRLGQDGDNEEYGGIPWQIFSLRNLRMLTLSYHCIHAVPDAIGRLRQLQMLFLANCPMLKSISGQAAKGFLKVLTLGGCDELHTPPREIVSQGMKVVIAYLRRLSQGSKSCSRTKLMFVGLGGAGKTSLMRALMNPNFKTISTHAEGITDGIDISTWSIHRNKVKLQFSVWDFAGQTIYYNTHQFFLSTRAVYILVWNTRLGFEHSGLEFWLSSIACHCPKAPIFIVGTHADQITNPELPQDSLRKRYSNIAGFFTVSALTGQGVEVLLETLIGTTLQQPYMGEMIPECWLRFEKYVLKKRTEQSIMPWKQLLSLSHSAAIYGAEIRQAVQFLHELGTLQHFDNELLRDRVVINPQWIVDVMACVVSVHNKVVKEGHLHHEDIAELWKEYPKDLHKWLLRLTEVFDLTFPLDDKPVNVVPCLLPAKEPEYDWPSSDEHKESHETKMIYRFEYLPAGLFNRVQVRLHQYSDGATLWKTGSLLKKNSHIALVQQTGDSEVLVKAFGQRPENIILLVHEVFEALISEFFQGVKYQYQVPCPDCLRMETRDPTMFSSKVLRRAIEMKALFLQCHTFFHTLSMRDIQNVMPPQSNSDYSLQLQSTVQQLDELHDDLGTDIFILYCQDDVPEEGAKAVHPRTLKEDLETHGFTCSYNEELKEQAGIDLTETMSNSKVVLLLMSEVFSKDPHCQAMFYHAKDKLHKQILMTVVGEGFAWRETEIGARVGHWLYVNLQRFPQYSAKLEELVGRLQLKLDRKAFSKSAENDIFLSYCWTNSAKALAAGHTRKKEGAISHGDPRQMHEFLQKNSISSWLDIEQTGRTGLFEDIAEGMKKCKVVVACVSDEYAQSANCQMEFRFAHIALRKPIILAVVGTGFLWESTEVGMLSLGYPKINYQVANEIAHQQLLQYIRERLQQVSEPAPVADKPAKPDDSQQKNNAFRELYELAQRKFLRQISSFLDPSDHYPRLFVADLNYDPSSISRQQSEADGEEREDDLDMTLPDGSVPSFVISDLKRGQFCIKTLCEYEGGWHCEETEGVPVALSGPDLVALWQMAAPYMSRILAILKHSDINLHVINSEAGHKMMKVIEQRAGQDSEMDLRPLYMEIRKYIKAKDVKAQRGSLARCYMASGKVLWLCKKHQKQARVTVLKDTDLNSAETTQDEATEEEDAEEATAAEAEEATESEEATQSEPPEVTLLAALRQLTEECSKSDVGTDETAGDNNSKGVDETGDAKEILKEVQPKPQMTKTLIPREPKDQPPNTQQSEKPDDTADSKTVNGDKTVPKERDRDNKAVNGEFQRTLSEDEKKKVIHRASAHKMGAISDDVKYSKACIIL